MKTTINMFQHPKADEVPKRKFRIAFIPVIVLVMLGVIVCGVYASTYFTGQALDAQLATAHQFTDDPENIANMAAVSALQAQLGQYSLYTQTVEDVHQNLSSVVKFDSSVYGAITSVKPSRVSFTGLSLMQNTVTIECTTADNLPPADFAQALDQLDVFSQVDYKGFIGEAEAGYTFVIACVLPTGGALQ